MGRKHGRGIANRYLIGAVCALGGLLTLWLSGGELPNTERSDGSSTASTDPGDKRPPASSSAGVLRGTLGPAKADQVTRSVRWLAQLPTTAGKPASSYRREAFGAVWKDIDDNQCNQRDDVLLRDAEPSTTKVGRQSRCDHDVLAGTWVDPYGGETIRLEDAKAPGQSQRVQIDHLVPLEEVWRSGGSYWSEQRRETYANTLDVLVASGGSANEAKGSRSPAEWVPARQATRCPYAVAWVRLKHTWGLTVTSEERRSLEQLLARCSRP